MAMHDTGFPEEPLPGVRLYDHPDGTWTVADHGGWVSGIFPTRDDALAATEPCTDACTHEEEDEEDD